MTPVVHLRTGTWTSACGWGKHWTRDPGLVTCKLCLAALARARKENK